METAEPGGAMHTAEHGGAMHTAEPGGTAGRRHPGRPRMDTARIVDAAMRLIDEHGADEVTMRSLAEHLGSSTSTLYRHFPTRAGLIGAVIDRMFGHVNVDPAAYRGTPWRAASQRFTENLFEVMGRHRNVSLQIAHHAPIGTNAAVVRERWLAIMLENGFPVPLAARSGAMIAHLVLGFVIQLGGERADQQRERRTMATSVHRLDLTEFPATAAVAEARWRTTSIEEEFAFALELVLDRLWELHAE